MEQIETEINKLQQRSSQIDRTATAVIPVEKQQALGDVFDRWRLNNGWNPWDDGTQMAAITSFVHSLDREHVPASAYGELFERVLQLRAKAIQDVKSIPAFGVDLMLAAWSGEWGLRNEIKQREIAAGRTLNANAESQCQRCFGTGFETLKNAAGTEYAHKCDHGNK